MRYLRGCIAAILGLFTAAHYRPVQAAEDGGARFLQIRAGEFVRTSGTAFVLDGHRFQVTGVNNHYLTYGSREEVVRVLDDAVSMGANVVRTFIQPVIGADDGTIKTIWNRESRADSSNLGAHGVRMLSWDAASSSMVFHDDENGLQRLDFLLTEARRRNLRLIIAFLDFWPYMGGAPQISAWYGSADKYTFFANDARTRQAYKDWVRHVLSRVNESSGVAYRDDPTIFAWELMNEPDIHPADLLMAWLAEMAGYVKSMDQKHLLATGHSNMMNRLADLAIPNIDFGTWHGYPAYEKISIEQFNALISDFCAKGREFGKPVILEEFGVARWDQRQADAYRMWSSTIRSNPDCAGWMVWRLVSQQDGGRYPDDHDGFDVVNDGGPAWTALKDAAGLAAARASQTHMNERQGSK